jgi:hypothetical protein
VVGVDHPEWDWEKTDPAHSLTSGDIAKFFKNEGTKNPGVLAKGAPPDAATLTAREVIQNSWDAARELQETLKSAGQAAPNFEIEFEFTDLVGQAKSDMIGRLDLAGLHARLNAIDAKGENARAAVGLSEQNALDTLVDEKPLRILRVIERGASGMYGPFTGDQSKLYLALVSIGYTAKAEGSGGSYGYGKAGLIAASSIRTVVAYTGFQPQKSEPGVTRRLLGMTYWGQHSLDGNSNTGFARFGHFTEGWTRPFENDQADQVAEGLGFTLRDPNMTSDLGTTFLLIDPVIEPGDLIRAIERNWWPALESNEFVAFATVNSADGKSQRIDAIPRQDPVLKSFISSWDLATTSQDVTQSNKVQKPIGTYLNRNLGTLGLLAKTDGWSYAQVEAPTGPQAEDDDDTDVVGRQSSLVALIRGPKMVVEYLVCDPGKTPYLRGVFVADEEVDDLLRQTEPKAHDSWQTKFKDVAAAVDSEAPKFANEILKRIRKEVREMQKRLKPPPPAPEDINLPEFQDLFRKLMSGGSRGGIKPPPPGDRDVSLQFPKKKLVAAGDGRVRLEARIAVRLSETFKAGEESAEATCAVEVSYAFLEDGRKGAACKLSIVAPPGFFQEAPGRFTGVLGRNEVSFEVSSEAYSSDWSARLGAIGKVLKPVSEGGQ